MPLKTNRTACTLKEDNSGDHVCLLCFANYPEESFVSISINTAVILGLLLSLLKRNKNEVSVVGLERFFPPKIFKLF